MDTRRRSRAAAARKYIPGVLRPEARVAAWHPGVLPEARVAAQGAAQEQQLAPGWVKRAFVPQLARLR